MQSGGRAKDGSAEPHGVKMEQHLRTSNSNIYAVGFGRTSRRGNGTAFADLEQ